MNKKFNHFKIKHKNSTKLINYNFLELPGTGFFRVEVVNDIGSNIERLVYNKQGKNIFGLSHLVEHLSFKSTKDYTTDELMDTLRTKGTYNASTDYERINYFYETAMYNRDLAIKLVCNYAFNDLKKVNEEEFKTERQVVYNEAKRYMDDDQTMFSVNVPVVVADLHPQDNVLGIPEVIETFTLEDASWLKQLFLTYGGLTVNVTYDPLVDNYAIINFLEVFEKELSRYNLNYINSFPHDIMNDYNAFTFYPNNNGQTTIDNESEQSMSAIVINASRKDYYMDRRLAVNYLSQYAKDTSLNQLIREKNGLTYGIGFESTTILNNDNLKYWFSCDITRGTESKMLELFNQACMDTAKGFTEEEYIKLLEVVRLKINQNKMNSHSYNLVFHLQQYEPEVFKLLKSTLEEDVDKGIDLMLDKTSYKGIKKVLKDIAKKVKNEDMLIIGNYYPEEIK